MREIEFRGKQKDTGEWVHGGYMKADGADYAVIWEAENGGGFGAHVFPETVGQYTGFKDINGVKIFEGDIIRCVDKYSYDKEKKKLKDNRPPGMRHNWMTYVIKWMDNHIEGEPNAIDYPWFFYLIIENMTVIEVIGNIHDSPELLEAETNA